MADDPNYWPGKRFGLPESGPRSTPTFARRLAAFAIDWIIAMALAWLWRGESLETTDTVVEVGPLAIFVAISTIGGWWILAIFVILHQLGGLILGGSPGHLMVGIRIAPIRGGRLGVLAPLVRPLLIALVLPAVISDDDDRGMHDRLVGTILVTR